MMLGSIHLIPVPLAPEQTGTIPGEVRTQATRLKYYFVENLRTARRMLKAFDKDVDIDSINFCEINKQKGIDTALLKNWLTMGYDVGVMSEAGCPGVADPGAEIVAYAQQLGAKVMPYVGPSSILLALMASGFSGQRFRFLGYLPVKEPMRSKAIKEMEHTAHSLSETQIFIETPYRNNTLIEELIKNCHPKKTKLCIAVDITDPGQQIRSMTLADWAREKIDIHKRPAIFLIYPA